MLQSQRENNIVVRGRAPMRLGLAGGGTDVEPFCSQHGGMVLNATINLYAQTTLASLKNKIRFVSLDLWQEETYKTTDQINIQGPLRLHKAVYKRIITQFNQGKPVAVEMTSGVDVPAGSGLGTSSTLVVALAGALLAFLDIKLSNLELARLCFDIERKDLGLSGGCQDQFCAAYGGMNLMAFGPGESIVIDRVPMAQSTRRELEASLLLFYTGVSRHSSIIIDEQVANLALTSGESERILKDMSVDALRMRDAIVKGDLDCFSKIMRNSWGLKKKLASGITNQGLDAIYNTAISAGAEAGKISGAGGGGFFLFYVPLRNRFKVMKALSTYKGQCFSYLFTDSPLETW